MIMDNMSQPPVQTQQISLTRQNNGVPLVAGEKQETSKS